MSTVKSGKVKLSKSGLLSSNLNKASIFWICRSSLGYQCIGNLTVAMLEAGVDLDDFAASVFADLGVSDGSISLRLVLPRGDLVEVSAETSVELGPEVMDVTFTGAVPSWLTGRWVP